MSAGDNNSVHTELKRGINWEVLIGFAGVCVTLMIFLYNILMTQISRIDNSVILEFQGIHTHLDTIERSIGQLEGQLKKEDAALR